MQETSCWTTAAAMKCQAQPRRLAAGGVWTVTQTSTPDVHQELPLMFCIEVCFAELHDAW
jgi:hypothetical protein